MDRCGKSKIPLTIRPAIAPPPPGVGGGEMIAIRPVTGGRWLGARAMGRVVWVLLVEGGYCWNGIGLLRGRSGRWLFFQAGFRNSGEEFPFVSG